MKKRKVTLFDFLIAVAIRLIVRRSSFREVIEGRVEISTPLNSWKRLKEGVVLTHAGIDPYVGDMIHETPLTLFLFRYLVYLPEFYQDLVFVCFDLITAILLQKTAERYLYQLKRQEDQICNNVFKILRPLTEPLSSGDNNEAKKKKEKITEIDLVETPVFVAYAYLFNPYVILNCIASTTTVYINFLHAVYLVGLVFHQALVSTVVLSFITLHSFYPVVLLVPLCINFPSKLKQILLVFAISFIGLLFCSYKISNGWLFVDSTFKFILNVQDLTPNIGLFWYFFTEMFEHFRALFISTLQINATILYVIPLSLHLKDNPTFLAFIVISLTTVFKSYPCLGEVGFYLALLPLWRHLFYFMHQLFVVACILVITSVLGPTVWHLWIYSGSANANFFFGVTLAFATAQIFLFTDLLFSHKKRQFALKYGWPEESSDNLIILD